MDPFSSIIPGVTIDSREGVIRVFEEHLDTFERIISSEYPGPYQPLNGNPYIRWERRMMLWLGRISGELAMLEILQVLTPEQGQFLKARAQSMISRATAKATLEGGRV